MRPPRSFLLALAVALLCALVPAHAHAGPKFGATSTTDPYHGSIGAFDTLQAVLQRRVAIVHWFQNWGGDAWSQEVHPSVIRAVAASGRKALLSWEPRDANFNTAAQDRFALPRILAGDHDAFLLKWASELRDVNQLVYLRPMHEFNGNWYPWAGTVNGNDPVTYRRVWRYIHRIFEAVGADNVRWVWAPNAGDIPNTPVNRMERYYPGAKYVDILGMDGYNWGAAAPARGGWRSFARVFKPTYERLTKVGRQPIWITETGSASDGGDKAGWVRNMWKTAAKMKRLRAIVWFDENKERDWRATSSPDVARAFRVR